MDNDESLLLCTPDTNKKVKFPFFDLPENGNSASRNYDIPGRDTRGAGSGLFTPSPSTQAGYSTPIDSNWESEISPISRTLGSSGRTLDVPSDEIRMTTPKQNHRGEHSIEDIEDIDSMLTELKDIIHQSQKKQKERRRSSISRRRSSETDFLVDALTRQPQLGDSKGPMSPPFAQSGGAASPQRTPPPTDTAEPSAGIIVS